MICQKLTTIFLSFKNISKLDFHQNCIKKYIETTLTFLTSKLGKKSTSKRCWFFTHWNCVEKSTSKLHQFWPIEIKPKKVHRNEVDFLPIKIALKKYAEMTWKFVYIFCSMYQRNIDIESTSIWRNAIV